MNEVKIIAKKLFKHGEHDCTSSCYATDTWWRLLLDLSKIYNEINTDHDDEDDDDGDDSSDECYVNFTLTAIVDSGNNYVLSDTDDEEHNNTDANFLIPFIQSERHFLEFLLAYKLKHFTKISNSILDQLINDSKGNISIMELRLPNCKGCEINSYLIDVKNTINNVKGTYRNIFIEEAMKCDNKAVIKQFLDDIISKNIFA
jgi:hypothetical protein